MRRSIITTVALVMLLTACGGGLQISDPRIDAATSTTTTVIGPDGTVITGPPDIVEKALVQFDSCDAVLAWIQAEALERVGPWGLNGGPVPWAFGVDDVFAVEESADAAAPAATAGDGAGRAGAEFSTTNVQEAGIDEADLVKTDGDRIVVIAQGRLHLIDVTGSSPRITDSVSLDNGWAHELFLSGDRAIVMSLTDYFGGPIPLAEPGFAADVAYPGGHGVATITEVDLSDPGDLEVTRTLYVDGTYLSARAQGDTARIVLRSFPTGLQWEYPEDGGLRGQREAEEANRRIIENSTLDDWLPYFVLQDHRADSSTEGSLLPCGSISHPADFAGFNTVSILTIDLAEGLGDPDAFGLIADADTVYAAPDSMYVATQRWIDPIVFEENPDEPPTTVTSIHKFSTPVDGEVTYAASGSVDGYLLNQWALSEHEGLLRVAATSAPAWWGTTEDSESFVAVLADRGTDLEEIGRVDGLGEGERIFSVRYVGDVAYVVTFRQTDPLYTIDLSDPERPVTRGELKILGYSAYLHPLGDGLLLGIGQDADERGRTEGTQLSIFDVSDLDDPVRIRKLTISDSQSQVEWDHRAFTYWPAEDLAVIPLTKWAWDEVRDTEDYFAGAAAFEVGADGIRELGRVSHGDPIDKAHGDFWAAPIQRSLVIGDRLFTVSDQGVLVSQLTSLDTLSWLPFQG